MIQRPLSGDVLVLDFEGEHEHLPRPAVGEPVGRHARTLLKDGPLRVLLVSLGPGAAIAEHQAEGPITVQPLKGRIRFATKRGVHELGPGQLLYAARGIRHSVSSADGAAFLLTIAKATAADERTSL